jgi:hypothetical protein
VHVLAALAQEGVRPADAQYRKTADALTCSEASAETVNAIAFASSYHKKWFWSGVGGK